ncbi:uncharacterized protein LOC123016092 isoform X2 [Tribolium madens]|uniref:uncharacterized protein LOC123016092 isoform X2 n=1 Tax=Tribolium madens TaxID=41895 RepID=UPI001CF7205E|nr:uncharacterized protein LOC123016092 isoform X2 [Tribolium madens]
MCLSPPKTSPNLETRWSLEFQRRRELMKTMKAPTISEVKVVSGLPLALVIFEQSHEDIQEDLGVVPSLEGPKGELWVSPSDLLIGKVALTPPLTQKHIQALTHQGIIALGSEIEEKFVNEFKMEKEKAIKEREICLGKIFEVEKARAIKEALQAEERKFAKRMDEMRTVFENKISQLLWECFDQIKTLEEQLQVEIGSLNVIWQAHLDAQIKETIDRITEEFLEKMRQQEMLLVNIYTKKIRELKTKKKCAIEFERRKCKETLIQMKHKLHCENVANLMYLLCKERRKCKNEKESIHDDYLAQIKQHRMTIRTKNNTIKKLKAIRDKKTKQVKVRERCLIEILRQFQKFINYALKATPTQGEFLLNINKLIKFELDDYCLPQEIKEEQSKKTPQVIEVSSSLGEETDDYTKQIEQFIKEQNSEDNFEESDVLPAFYFNNKVYIREDFRDMLEAGIEVDRKNSLWNPDVEELIQIFRRQISAKLTDKSDRRSISKLSRHSSVHFNHEKSPSSSCLSQQILAVSPVTSKASHHDSTHICELKTSAIPTPSMDEEEKEIRKVSLETEKDKKKPKRPSIIIKESEGSTKKRESTDATSDLITPDLRSHLTTQSKLTLARDSLILHITSMERKSIQIMAKMADAGSIGKTSNLEEKLIELKSSPVEDDQELSFQEDEMKPLETQSIGSRGSLQKPPSKPTSKLLLANDSYELIKSTIALVGEKEKDKEGLETDMEQKKSQLTFNSKISVEGRTFEASAVGKTLKGKQIKTPRGKKLTPMKQTPRSVVKVAGSRKTKEHAQTVDEFTDERIKDLVNLMKENPSLIHLFTPCSK